MGLAAITVLVLDLTFGLQVSGLDLFGCQDSVQGDDDGIHARRDAVRVERSCLQPYPGLGIPQTLLDSSSQTCRVKPRRLKQERAGISQQSFVRPCSRSS